MIAIAVGLISGLIGGFLVYPDLFWL